MEQIGTANIVYICNPFWPSYNLKPYKTEEDTMKISSILNTTDVSRSLNSLI